MFYVKEPLKDGVDVTKSTTKTFSAVARSVAGKYLSI